MKAYMAPLEGITTYIYRNAYHAHFLPMDKYFTPFISPALKRPLRTRETRDVLPANNRDLPVVPQILTNDAELFLETCRALEQLGYREVNLNTGCPSGTVTARGKGAGFLRYPEELRDFLETVFSGSPLKISVKTRLGWESPEEFGELMEVFRDFPFAEMILHPRVRQEYYRGEPHREYLGAALEAAKFPVIYNGNLFRAEDVRRVEEEYPGAAGVMLGRGLISDPTLWGRCGREAEICGETGESGGRPGKFPVFDSVENVRAFHDEIYEGYRGILSGDTPVIHKMKELWYYMVQLFGRDRNTEKELHKIHRREEYERWAGRLFAERELCHDGFVPPDGWQVRGRCESGKN